MAEFLLNGPRWIFVQALPKRQGGQAYTEPEVRLSLYLDLDAGRVHSLGDYAALWGWNKGTLYKRWNGITRDVWMWCSGNENQLGSPMARKYIELIPSTSKQAFKPVARAPDWKRLGNGQETEWKREETKNGDSSTVGAPEETVWKPEETPRKLLETHTNHTPSFHPHPDSEIPPDSLRNHAPKGAKTARFRPPSVDEVRAYFAEKGRADLTDSFFDHYTANGWKVGGKAAMKDWQAAVRNWIRNDSKYGTNGKAQHSIGAESDIAGDFDRNRRLGRRALGLE